nr:DNA recombination protein RmuC [Euryarchaeota archaeon]
MVEVVSVLLAVIVAGIGIAIGWLVSSKNMVGRVSRAEAIVETERATNEERLKQMQTAFELAATEAFRTAVKNADEEKESSFKQATELLSSSMNEYIQAIQDAKEKDIERTATLGEKVDNVSALGTTLAQETRELSLALRGDSQAQGAWGEVVVENLLQSMGFTNNQDYLKQVSETGTDGKRKKPDFVLNLPGNRQVIIDSKVSLTAYTEYVNAEDDESATSAIKAHCTSIRKHASILASKNYDHMESISTLDFVLMVVPLEGAFIDAMRADPNLYEDMVGDRKVKIVSGTSLMLTLMLIQELWNRERQTKNQAELVNRAGELHDKVVLFLESFTQVGFEIGQASEAYKEARDRLSSGRGNVIRQTEMLKELGAKTGKDLRADKKVSLLVDEAIMNESAISPIDMVIVEAEEE